MSSITSLRFNWLTRIRHLHWVATAALACGIPPLFRVAKLPLHFAWRSFFLMFWGGFALQSLFMAIVLYAIAKPRELLTYLANRGPQAPFPIRKFLAMLLPAAYFFVMFFITICYNDIIAAMRFNGSSDALLAEVDKALLFGHSVSSIAHFGATRLNVWTLKFLELVYFGMFPQIGACIILLAMKCGLRESFKFVASITTAYYISLVFFFFFPATGPYYGCQDHLKAWTAELQITDSQGSFVHLLDFYRAQGRPSFIATDYFIAIPSMHVVQPLLVLWFLRAWKRAFFFLAAYDVFLVVSIIALEQHYVVDVLMGVLVAIAAAAMVDWSSISATMVPAEKLSRKSQDGSVAR